MHWPHQVLNDIPEPDQFRCRYDNTVEWALQVIDQLSTEALREEAITHQIKTAEEEMRHLSALMAGPHDKDDAAVYHSWYDDLDHYVTELLKRRPDSIPC